MFLSKAYGIISCTSMKGKTFMGLRFCSFASGSTGNCYLVRTDDTALLVDCGISGKRIVEALGSRGLDPRDISGVLITHEHTDHTQSIRVMSKKADNAGFYATRGTIKALSDRVPLERFTPIRRTDSFAIGDIEIRSFGLFHDASEPVGYSFTCDGRMLSIVTDTGIVTDGIYEAIKDSNALILEANHEVNILRAGPYPYELQQRILSDFGHLSNVTAGEVICRILDDRHDPDDIPYVLLAHISRHNNTPYQAELTVQNMLFEHGYMPDRDVRISTASYCDAGPDIMV